MIQYCDGKKFMIPVATRADYLKIRDSEPNRRADKHHLVQMNYSCMPNADGTLRGSKLASNTFGMDIDFPKDAPNLDEMIEATKQKILDTKAETGLLMLEGSFSKGLHGVFRRCAELSQEDNLKRVSGIIGVEYDKGAKDITRVFFTPTSEKLFYLDDEVFKASASPVPSEGGGMEVTSSKDGVQEGLVEAPGKAFREASLHAFDLCVAQAGLSLENLDSTGSRHSNLLAVFSIGLAKLMSREDAEEVIRRRMPSFAQLPDCQEIVKYFYENYGSSKGYMSQALREINAKAQQMAQEEKQADESEGDSVLIDEWTNGWNPPEMPKKLPRIVELCVRNYDPRFREMLALSTLPILSAHASHYHANYVSGKEIGAQQYVAVIGSSGSGKGNCTELFKEMVEHTLQENDRREWEKEKENHELRDKKANAKERPERYHPRLRLFETASKSSILQLQSNLGEHGMLLGQFSEVDGLSDASRQSYSDLSVLLRKGWDGDVHRQFYMSDATCNTMTRMSLSLLMAGTPRAMLERMFSDKNCEGGLMQRCIPVLVPRAKRTFRPPMQNFLSDDERNERDALIVSLYQKDLALGDKVEILDLPKTAKAIQTWFDELEELYNDGKMTDAEADLSHRCGEMMMRAAIPLVALTGEETREIVDFCVWVGRMAHYNMCRIFGHRVEQNLLSGRKLMEARPDLRKTVEPLLDKMPNVFSLEDFKETRLRNGQTADCRSLLTRYCQKGVLKRVKRGVYQKVKS